MDRLKRLLVPSRSGEISDRGMESGSIVEALNEGEEDSIDRKSANSRPKITASPELSKLSNCIMAGRVKCGGGDLLQRSSSGKAF